MAIIESKIRGTPAYKEFMKAGGERSATGVCDALAAVLLPMMAQDEGATAVYIAPNDWAALNMAASSGGVYLPTREWLLRPATVSRENAYERISALSRLKNARVVCLSIGALRQRLCPPELFFSGFIKLAVGGQAEPAKIMDRLIKMGYERVPTAEGAGQAALRGDILDVVTHEGALRAEFFGDAIDALGSFDPATQRSGQKRESAVIPPAHELLYGRREAERGLEYVALELKRVGNRHGFDLISGKLEEYMVALEEGRPFDDMRNFLSALYPPRTIFDYLGRYFTIFGGYAQIEAAARQWDAEWEEAVKSAYVSNYALSGMEKLVFPLDYSPGGGLFSADIFTFGKSALFPASSPADFGSRQVYSYGAKIPELARDLKRRTEHGYTTLILTGAASRASTLLDRLVAEGVAASTNESETSPVYVLEEGQKHGFELKEAMLLILGEEDVYGRARPRQKIKASTRSVQSALIGSLKPGDVVVHDVHGKGRYLGLKTEKVAGSVRDYMLLEYKDGDRLYLPIDQIGRVQKYVSGQDEQPRLNKLGGKEWEASKARAKASLADLAQKLFALYSKRVNARGYMFSPDTVWQREFEDAFGYVETEGQTQAISEIKADMESGRVMDRLLLGDVGYGKTEVAMRACFKAVMDHKQCAVLAPTTLLCAQHYETFRDRFRNFPVSIACLSRFTSPAEQKKALHGLASGKVDIVVGTHRLLSKDVVFNDLGLLVVDEEHRFGVTHKERIKELKTNVDVLSLSATPIPRTLEMSLVGIRDLSTIETPIEERIPVSTYVLEYSIGLVREAALREKARGGQTFFVCRKVRTLERLASEIMEHVPELAIKAAHGQMPKEKLEGVMEEFVAGDFDMLMSTTIVESGLDIKNANTIIIYEADKFGLSELYQLKGRVGRSNVASYAYLTFLSEDALTEDARKRLNTLKDFTEFGSGLKIAMRDLEIRGAGNLLGAEQSGHMANVGYEMYLRFMKEAVSELKGEKVQEGEDTAVELNVEAYIDSGYIENEELRIEAYKRIASIRSKREAADMLEELKERYSEPPQAVKNLVTIALLKAVARSKGIASITRKTDSIDIKFSAAARPDASSLISAVNGVKGARLRPGEPAAIIIKNKKCTIIELFSMITKINCN